MSRHSIFGPLVHGPLLAKVDFWSFLVPFWFCFFHCIFRDVLFFLAQLSHLRQQALFQLASCHWLSRNVPENLVRGGKVSPIVSPCGSLSPPHFHIRIKVLPDEDNPPLLAPPPNSNLQKKAQHV